MLRAVWIQYMEAYRIYNDDAPNDTIAYVDIDELDENIEVDIDRD